MTGVTWFAVENNIVDRGDLTLEEKMCCVVLARYAGRQEFSNMLNLQVIAIRMGCTPAVAENALKGLMSKGLVTLEDAERIEPDRIFSQMKEPSPPSRVVKAEAAKNATEAPPSSWLTLELDDGASDEADSSPVEAAEVKKDEKKNINAPAKADNPQKSAARPVVPKHLKEEVQSLVDQVYEIIDENLNEREARIILSFANNNIERIREKYAWAKQAEGKDKIDLLITALQQQDSLKPQPAKEQRRVSATQLLSDEHGGAITHPAEGHVKTPTVETERRANQQIDLNQINSMAAFKQSTYGKKTKR